MQMRQLGAGGPEISVVGFGSWEAGGMHWGPNSSEQDVIAAIHAGLDAGMTWVDTAEVYGDGVSERIVGRAVAGRGDVLVFTKVAPDEGSGLRPDQVRGAIDASLQRLGRDHIDLYQVHWPSDDVPIEETWGAMAELVTAGKARLIGVSNFDRALIERCQAIHPVASVQNEFSRLHRGDRDELLPWLAAQGIGYLAYSPLAAGRLSGALPHDHAVLRRRLAERPREVRIVAGRGGRRVALRPGADGAGCGAGRPHAAAGRTTRRDGRAAGAALGDRADRRHGRDRGQPQPRARRGQRRGRDRWRWTLRCWPMIDQT